MVAPRRILVAALVAGAACSSSSPKPAMGGLRPSLGAIGIPMPLPATMPTVAASMVSAVFYDE